ncbi:MAG: HEPN domain-containing protein [Prevotella sp.]|nr:HEPN domain-containing protein [Prevotella sp.]
MTPEQRSDLVDYFFERAHESIEEAKYPRDGGYFNGAVTRLYYACFNASRGLLTANGIDTSTHHGVKTMVSMAFIRKGLLGIEHGATLNDLFNQRQASDYEAYAFRDASSVEFLLPKAVAYIEAVESLARTA